MRFWLLIRWQDGLLFAGRKELSRYLHDCSSLRVLALARVCINMFSGTTTFAQVCLLARLNLHEYAHWHEFAQVCSVARLNLHEYAQWYELHKCAQ